MTPPAGIVKARLDAIAPMAVRGSDGHAAQGSTTRPGGRPLVSGPAYGQDTDSPPRTLAKRVSRLCGRHVRHPRHSAQTGACLAPARADLASA